MGALITFPARPFPKPEPVAPVAPVEHPVNREFRLAMSDLGKGYPHTADRAAEFFRQSQTGPLRTRSSALGAAFAELASIPPQDDVNASTARYAALLLVAIAFPTSTSGAA